METGRRIGEVHVGISEAPVAKAVRELRETVYVIAGIALGAALIVAFIYGVVLTRPLLRISAGVGRIGRGDLKHRIKVRRKDEMVQSWNVTGLKPGTALPETVRRHDGKMGVRADEKLCETG